ISRSPSSRTATCPERPLGAFQCQTTAPVSRSNATTCELKPRNTRSKIDSPCLPAFSSSASYMGHLRGGDMRRSSMFPNGESRIAVLHLPSPIADAADHGEYRQQCDRSPAQAGKPVAVLQIEASPIVQGDVAHEGRRKLLPPA